MTGINHVLTGAVIATTVSNPFVGLPLAFFSHFVLDALPHFGVEDESKMSSNLFRSFIVSDSLLSVLALILVPTLFDSWYVLGAMLVAISADFVWFIKFFYDKARQRDFVLPKDIFSRFHKKIQWGEFRWGWILEIIYVLIIGGVLLEIYRG